ncbi:uncharacterized protein G2W53_040141 [Senna tora]|uniref:Uncharacterized protein n=1 Tax=Senna tora TaxID=362788 RepID=A0A834W3G0_9FABA|nr:uncharacterized protein G2W53_040141 [Senna tora]
MVKEELSGSAKEGQSGLANEEQSGEAQSPSSCTPLRHCREHAHTINCYIYHVRFSPPWNKTHTIYEKETDKEGGTISSSISLLPHTLRR